MSKEWPRRCERSIALPALRNRAIYIYEDGLYLPFVSTPRCVFN
jgi:hypothetical protein